jgi:error-prone DNA polymerase
VPNDSVRDVWLRTGLHTRVLERLADADTFNSLGLTRRDALWAAKALGRVGDRDDDLPLFAPSLLPPPERGRSDGEAVRVGVSDEIDPHPNPPPFRGRENRSREPDVALPPMPIGEEVVNDYRFLRLSLKAHPAQFLRNELARRGIKQNEILRSLPNGTRVKISGLVTCRQRPGSANGVVFMTIEDESAVANVIVWPKVFERVRPVVLGARYVIVTGPVQQESGVIHVVAEQLEDQTALLAHLAQGGGEIDSLARCDEVRRPIQGPRHPQGKAAQSSHLEKIMRQMPELAADLDVTARGSAHAPTRRAG